MRPLLRQGDEVLIKVTVRENHGDVLMVQLDEPRGLTRFPVDLRSVVLEPQGASLVSAPELGSLSTKVCAYHDGCPPDAPVCHLCADLQPASLSA